MPSNIASGARFGRRLWPALAFAAGLELGLLLASAFSTFYRWWALEAAIFATANGAAVVVAYRTEPHRESP